MHVYTKLCCPYILTREILNAVTLLFADQDAEREVAEDCTPAHIVGLASSRLILAAVRALRRQHIDLERCNPFAQLAFSVRQLTALSTYQASLHTAWVFRSSSSTLSGRSSAIPSY